MSEQLHPEIEVGLQELAARVAEIRQRILDMPPHGKTPFEIVSQFDRTDQEAAQIALFAMMGDGGPLRLDENHRVIDAPTRQ